MYGWLDARNARSRTFRSETLEERLQLRQGALDAIPLDRDGAGDSLIPGAVLLQLGEDRNVLVAEDLDLGPEACQSGLERRRVE